MNDANKVVTSWVAVEVTSGMTALTPEIEAGGVTAPRCRDGRVRHALRVKLALKTEPQSIELSDAYTLY